VTGTYGGNAILAATLTSNGQALPNEFVNFTINGTNVGSATTDANGLATTSASVFGINAGTYSADVTASFTGDRTYPASNTATADLTVTPAPLTITANDATAAYGVAPTFVASYSGFIGKDSVASLTTPPVLSAGNTINPVGTYAITASGAVDPNYTISYVAGTLTVTPAPLTVTADNQFRVYPSGPFPTLTATITGFANGDTAATSVTGSPVLSTTATFASPIGFYPISISQGTLAASANYTFAGFNGGTLTVGPAAPVITSPASGATYIAGTPVVVAGTGTAGALVTIFDNGVPGVFGGSTTVIANGTFSATLVGLGVGVHVLTATESVAKISSLASNAVTVMEANPTTLTANPASGNYGGTTTLTAGLTAGGTPLPNETVSFSIGGTAVGTATTDANGVATLAGVSLAGENVPGNVSVTASFAGDNSNTASNATASLTVNPVPLTITADDQISVYGAALPTFTADYSGFVNGDTPASLGKTLAIVSTATATSPVGTYPITAGGAFDQNYTISYVAGTLTVTPAPLTVTANNQFRDVDTVNPPLTATVTGLVNRDDPLSVLSGSAGLTTTATTASPVGTYAIVAAQGTLAANANYYFATFVNGTLTVQPTAPVLTAPADKTVLANPGTVLVTGTGTAGAVVTILDSGVADGSVTVAADGTFSTNAFAGYGINSFSATQTISGITSDPSNTAGVSVLVPAPAITSPAEGAQIANTNLVVVSGTGVPGAAVTFTDAVGKGNVNVNGSATVDADGTYSATLSLDQGSYSLSAVQSVGGLSSPASNTVDLTVLNQETVLTVTPVTGTYGGTATLTATLTAASVPLTNETVSFSLNGTSVGTASVDKSGTATLFGVSLAGLNDGTYTAYVSASFAGDGVDLASTGSADLKVSPAALKITVDPTSKTYGAPVPTLTATYSGLVNGDTPASLGTVLTTTATAASPVGSYVITLAAGFDPNYAPSVIVAKLTVTPATLTVTADNKSRPAGAANPPLTATIGGFVNGDTATSAGLVGGPTLNTAATTASPVGVYPITVSQGTLTVVSGNYQFTFVPGTLSVVPPAPVILNPTNGATSSGTSVLVSGTAASLATVTIFDGGTADGTTVAQLGGFFSVSVNLAAGSHSLTAVQTVSGATSAASSPVNVTVLHQSTTLTLPPQVSVNYGGTVVATATLMSGGFGVPNETVTFSVNGTVVGTALTDAKGMATLSAVNNLAPFTKNNLTASFAGDANYLAATASSGLEVNPAPLTITADDQTSVYGAALPTFTASYSGFVNGDTPASLSRDVSFNTTATAGSPADTYPITAGGAFDQNYTISYVTGTLTVTPAPLTVTADNQARAINAVNPPLTATVTGFVNGDTAASAGLAGTAALDTSASTASPAGVYPISVSQGTLTVDTNYAFSNFVAGTLTVTPPAPVITSPADGATVSVTAVTVSGTAEAGAAVTLFDSGTPLGTVTADAVGNFADPLTLAYGSHSLSATEVVGGLTSVPSNTVNLMVQKTATALAVAAATGTVGGTTTLSATLTTGGNGVPNEVISFSLNGVSEGTATTNSSGVASLSSVSLATTGPGTYTNAITASFAGDANSGSSTGAATLTVTAANPTLKTFPSSTTAIPGGQTGSLVVTVVDQNGNALTDANVVLQTPTGSISQALPTTTTGMAIFGIVPVGTYTLIATDSNLAGSANINVAPGSNAFTLTITPPSSPTATVTVYVTDLENGEAPIQGATVAVYVGASDTPVATQETDGSGNATFTGLPTGVTLNYLVTTLDGRMQIQLQAGGLEAGTNATLEIPIDPQLGNSPLTLTDTAMISGGFNPTGTLTFTLFLNGGTTPLDTETVQVNGNGLYSTPFGYTLATGSSVTGTYQWDANYSGDSNNNVANDNNDPTEQTFVSAAAPTITTTAGGAVQLGGGNRLSDSATIANAYFPSGFIVFTLYGPDGTTVLDTETAAVNGNGTYSTPTGYLPAATGTDQWVASYSGDSNNDSVSGTPGSEPEVVSPIPTTLAAGPASGTYGGTTTLTATLTDSSPVANEMIAFALNGVDVGDATTNASGVATLSGVSLAGLTAGTYTAYVSASFAGDSTYAASSAMADLTVTPAALTISADNQAKVYGAALPALTASYSGFVNGDNAGSLTTAPTLSTTATATSPVGAYSITAGGAADPNYTISYGAGTLTVTPAALTITANNVSKVYGAALPTLTASYSGFANGDNAASLTTLLTLSTTASAASHVGSYAITASGAADANYAIAFVAGTLTVTPAALTITANNLSKTYGAALPTLTATYTGFVNGDSAASLTTPPILATTASPTSNVGTYPITAGGAVDPDYAISYVSGTLTITQAQPGVTLVSSANPSSSGQSVTFTATVSPPFAGAPGGSVQFQVDSSNFGSPVGLVGGSAAFGTASLGAGTHTITAVYNGDPNFLGGSASLSQVVQVAAASFHGLLVLDPTASGSLTLSGNASVQFPAAVQVDSSSATALSASGNASLGGTVIDVVGGYRRTGNAAFNPTPVTGAAYEADPLAGLPAPSAGTNQGSVNVSGNNSLTINPGTYTQIVVSGNGQLTMNAGIYIIQGGGMSVTGNATVTGNGVTIYNAGNGNGNCGGLSLSGNGVINLSAPTCGPYAGILIFQARDNTRALSFSGNGTFKLGGIVYAPAAPLSESGNGQVTTDLIVDKLTVSGNGTLTQTAGSGGTDDGSGIADTLLGRDLWVYVSDPDSYFTSDELARVQDAINGLDTLLAPYSVTITEVTDGSLADVVLTASASSPCGGAADGILGCYDESSNQITVLEGWNWFAGSDPTGIGADQYDFQTTVTHELGHALGLGHEPGATSPMYGTLAAATVNRTMTVADLNIPDPPGGSDPLTAAGWQAGASNRSTGVNQAVTSTASLRSDAAASPSHGSMRTEAAAGVALSRTQPGATVDVLTARVVESGAARPDAASSDGRSALPRSRADTGYLQGGGDEADSSSDEAGDVWFKADVVGVTSAVACTPAPDNYGSRVLFAPATLSVAAPASPGLLPRDGVTAPGEAASARPAAVPNVAALDAYFAGTSAVGGPGTPVLLPAVAPPEERAVPRKPSGHPGPVAAVAAFIAGVSGRVVPVLRRRKRRGVEVPKASSGEF
jgi:hypothetical protein